MLARSYDRVRYWHFALSEPRAHGEVRHKEQGMGPTLRMWIPCPVDAPIGLAGVVCVAAMLLLSVSHIHGALALIVSALLLMAGSGFSILSLVRERCKAFGYLGMAALFLHITAWLTTSLLFAVGLD